MLHLHAGPRIRCVTGCRSRVSVCMSTWPVCGFPPVRLFYRPRKQTSRGWDEVKQVIQRTSGMICFKSVFVSFRNWASSIHCTERSCNWLCRLLAQRKRTTRESWTTTGWWVSSMLAMRCWISRSCFVLYALSFRPGWLDDIGLPQYKTQFDEARVDGRMLHYMTVVSVSVPEDPEDK